MMQPIYLYVYCRKEAGIVAYMRAYKYERPKPNTTPNCSLFLYSEKSKRYHETFVYFMDWKGNSLSIVADPKMFRYAITRIGLDVR